MRPFFPIFVLLSFFALPTETLAAVITAEVSTSVLNSPSGGGYTTTTDAETSSNATTDSFVDATSSGTGTLLSTGETLNTATASASADYLSGELKAKVEAEASGAFSGRISGGRAEARLQDEISFSIDPTATSTEVVFQWTVERTLLGNTGTLGTSADNVSVDTFVQIRDGFSSFGNTLVSETETFTTSGTDIFQWVIDLASLPNLLVRIDLMLRADADTYCDTDSFGGECSLSVLADASNTGFLNIITPDGITFVGSDDGFLSQARSTGEPGAVPLPSSLLLTASGLLALGFGRRQRSKLRL